jgi:4-hydroxy-3-methylbut-2-enyl diphosphate reductase IspH
MNDFKKIQKFKIDIAKDCGFCSGVNLAIEKAKEAA